LAGAAYTTAIMEAELPAIHQEIAVVASQLADLALLLKTVESKKAAALLQASWVRLIDLLALPPPAESRQCPRCGNVGMRAATLCGYCWTPLMAIQ
jgi:hypothetical protein